MEAISPDKIAESYKELYHNGWSAAYKALQKTGMIVMEEEIVKKLSTILHVSFILCCPFCVSIIKAVDRFPHKTTLGHFHCIINLYWHIFIYVSMLTTKEIMI